jgi:hypothetical protein
MKVWGLLMEEKLQSCGMGMNFTGEGSILLFLKKDAERERKKHRADPKRFKVIPVILNKRK